MLNMNFPFFIDRKSKDFAPAKICDVIEVRLPPSNENPIKIENKAEILVRPLSSTMNQINLL